MTGGGGAAPVPVLVATGYVVAPDDNQALGAVLSKLVDDPDLARDMGMAGRVEVERHFNMANQIVPFLDILREVAGKG